MDAVDVDICLGSCHSPSCLRLKAWGHLSSDTKPALLTEWSPCTLTCLRSQPLIYHFFFFLATLRHAESLFSDQGWNLQPLQWKSSVLTTDYQGSSHNCSFSESKTVISKYPDSFINSADIYWAPQGTRHSLRTGAVNNTDPQDLGFMEFSS